jgi:gamma-glutamylcyclotransferase (GGCT)/AIG2-like uncharacterized protein YtfP
MKFFIVNSRPNPQPEQAVYLLKQFYVWRRPLLFVVYGTLKPGERAFASLCEPFAIAAQPAQTVGRLYHLPLGYPAMTTEPGWVQGVLLTLSSPNALTAIDAFEEYYPSDPRAVSISGACKQFMTRASTP